MRAFLILLNNLNLARVKKKSERRLRYLPTSASHSSSDTSGVTCRRTSKIPSKPVQKMWSNLSLSSPADSSCHMHCSCHHTPSRQYEVLKRRQIGGVIINPPFQLHCMLWVKSCPFQVCWPCTWHGGGYTAANILRIWFRQTFKRPLELRPAEDIEPSRVGQLFQCPNF